MTRQDSSRAGRFIAYSARVVVWRNPPKSWWTRLVDWAWPPIVRYGRRGTFTLEVNGKRLIHAPLALVAIFDRRTGTARSEFPVPIAIEPTDVFRVLVEFDRGVPATLHWTGMLDGVMENRTRSLRVTPES